MKELTKLLFSLSLSASFLILLFFLFKPFFQERFSKRWQYYIWLIILLRFLLPFSPKLNLMDYLFQKLEPTSASVQTTRQTNSPFSSEYDSDPQDDSGENHNLHSPKQEEQVSIVQHVFTFFKSSLKIVWNFFLFLLAHFSFIWILVAFVMFAHKITVYQSFVQYIKTGCNEITDINGLEYLGKIVEQEGIKNTISLYSNSMISSPLLIGFFRPSIILPSTHLSDSDFYYTILHELTHYKRKDMLYKWFVQFTVCIHWFNPLVYWMEREINRLCELSCDEAVIRNLDQTSRYSYGDTLIHAIGTGGDYKDSILSVALYNSKKLLKERLDAIMKYHKSTKIKIIFSLICSIIFCFSAFLTGAYGMNFSKELSPDSIPYSIKDTKSIPNRSSSDQESRIAFELQNNPGQLNISESGSFLAYDQEVLVLSLSSDIKSGSVDLFLFNPQGQSQTISLSKGNQTMEIPLSSGTWAYNCSGMFRKGGNVHIQGVIYSTREKDIPEDKPSSDQESRIAFELQNNPGQLNISESGSFLAYDQEVLVLSLSSDIKSGSVDLFLFNPQGQSQTISLSKRSQIMEIPLSSGTWAYNCSGMFRKGGNVHIQGVIYSTREKDIPEDKPSSDQESRIAFELQNNPGQLNISESGSFLAYDQEVLVLSLSSDIKSGSVDLFLFNPQGQSQTISLSKRSQTMEIPLSSGTWAYNCSGMFRKGGNVHIQGVIYSKDNNQSFLPNQSSYFSPNFISSRKSHYFNILSLEY